MSTCSDGNVAQTFDTFLVPSCIQVDSISVKGRSQIYVPFFIRVFFGEPKVKEENVDAALIRLNIQKVVYLVGNCIIPCNLLLCGPGVGCVKPRE